MNLRRLLAPLMLLSFALLGANANAAVIVIINNDMAGVGFNDTTPKTPEGGNPGTTLGAQRLYLFQAVAREWGALLKSNLIIRIIASFDSLPCSSGSGVLGEAGPTSFITLVPTPPSGHANTFYAEALAESLLGADGNSGAADIQASFNSSIDNGCIAAGTRFYYGVNPATPIPSGTFGLYPTVLHELGHGLGFLTLVCTDASGCGSGQPQGSLSSAGIPDIWTYFLASSTNTGLLWKDMTNAQRAAGVTSDPNLVWLGANVTADLATFAPTSAGTNGGHMRMFAPATVQPGSSVSHFSSAAVSPNLLMEPVLQSGVFNNTDLTYSLLKDIGWQVRPRDTIFADSFDAI
ncbi:hypothetical protein ELE36_01770 [Pseudolysobacter antarcticus]|uniref:Peptidase n=1 Tax=Pseudolysobacter antarcticus TaxID=2511995 RepID=A0A411HFE1_9GAMM|nr:hypothetical protein [Pseudolysobacter antarcticus]QBB69205.1 hypothetical protein ELE36_01770 [Pseudolysobacter antarcticus]